MVPLNIFFFFSFFSLALTEVLLIIQKLFYLSTLLHGLGPGKHMEVSELVSERENDGYGGEEPFPIQPPTLP